MTETTTWRDTLYVWDGILVTTTTKKEKDNDNEKSNTENEPPRPTPPPQDDDDSGTTTTKTKCDSNSVVAWEGTWVACRDAPDARTVEAPRRGAFDELVASDLHFQVEGTARKVVVDDDDDDDHKDDDNDKDKKKFRPVVATLTQGQGWDLIVEEGKEEEEELSGSIKKKKIKRQDEEHEVLLANLQWSGDLRDKRNNLAFARGKNEHHGSFVSAGWMRPGNRLTLARRYVEEADVRAQWDLTELREAVLEEIYDDDKKKKKEGGGGKVRIPPWQCQVFHSALRTKKRAREDEGEEEEAPQVKK